MNILIEPIITEKQTDITDSMPNRYGFRVSRDANKLQIKKAVEKMYDVDVISVNTMRYSGKKQVRYTRGGIIRGKKNAFKKAIVTVAPDQTIDFYGNI